MDKINLLMDFSNPIFQLIIAVLLGAFVGLRREAELQKNNEVGFRGLRTTALVSAFGVISTFFPQFDFLPVIIFLIISFWIVIAYVNGVKNGKIGMTSEVSLLLIFWAGVLIGYQEFILGIILSLLVATSDAYKDKMHSFAKTLKLKEWSGTMQMILITLVILPFLPKEPIDPWGVFIPYHVWLLVVLVTGIGFIGYFLNKFFHKSKFNGIYLTSFVGSILSSTAVTVQLSQKVKKNKKIEKLLTPALMIAISVMLIRDIFIINIASSGFYWDFVKVPVGMLIASMILFIYYFYKNIKNKDNVKIKFEDKSPFEILPAIKFTVIFVSILFLIHFIKEWVGDGAVYFTTFLVSLVDTETIILPAMESFKNSTFDLNLTSNVISIAIIVNTIIKLFYIQMFAGKKVMMKTLPAILAVSLAGISMIFLF